jgi:uncharacterized protein
VSLSSVEMDAKLDEHFAFEARDDVEGVLATLAVDAEHDVVGSPYGPTRGREAARAFYTAVFSDLSESEVQTVRRLHGKDFVDDESHWRGRAPGAPFGLQGKNRPVDYSMSLSSPTLAK